MPKLQLTKDSLKVYKSIALVMENCEVYNLDTSQVLDINCIATSNKERKNTYIAKEGFIKISSQAATLVDTHFDHYPDLDSDYNLLERLQMFDGASDVVRLSLMDYNNQSIDVILPYDPLCSVLNGAEVDFSNCPSFQIDEQGNMLILFGTTSKQPSRIDNNYSQLIGGWSHHFGNYSPRLLSAKLQSISTFGNGSCNVSCQLEVGNKSATNQDCCLIFLDCANIKIEMLFSNNGNCKIRMSQMSNGQIYVCFQNIGIEFTCSSVMEYNHYCNCSK